MALIEIDKARAQEGISNFHRILVRETKDVIEESAEFAASNMRIRMPHASFKSAEGVHTVGLIPRTGPFGHPEWDKIAETDDSRESAVRYFYWGTGLWGPFHRKYGPKRAKAMLFRRTDGGNFTSLVSGQSPQRNWYTLSKHYTSNFVRIRINTMIASLEARTRTF